MCFLSASPSGSASHLSLSLSSTPPCWSLLIHSLSLQPTLTFSLSGGTAYTRGDQRILLEISVHRYKVQQSATYSLRLRYRMVNSSLFYNNKVEILLFFQFLTRISSSKNVHVQLFNHPTWKILHFLISFSTASHLFPSNTVEFAFTACDLNQ